MQGRDTGTTQTCWKSGIRACPDRISFAFHHVVHSAAPLMAGNDIMHMSGDTRDILTNKEMIAVDQDPLGIQGHRVRKDGDLEIWSKQLSDGSRAVALLNRGAGEQKMTANWTDIGYPESLSAQVRDIWNHKDLGHKTGSFSASVPSHGVVVIKVKP